MQQFSPIVLLFAALSPGTAGAGPAQSIELVDGSVVHAEVLSLNDGIYTLRSESLGQMRIPATQIKSITASSTTTAPISSKAVQVDALRRSLEQDPDVMGKLKTLQNNPLLDNILNDPTTMRAIQAGDFDSLMNNSKIKALMEHPTIREISQGADR